MIKNEKPTVIVSFEQNEITSKWGFTAFFGGCSITYGGYDTKDEARLTFERLRGQLGL